MTALNGIKFVKKSTIDDMATTNDESLYFAEVETYGPDGSGYWYKLYPNGWIEQGGSLYVKTDDYTTFTVYLPKEMKDTNYCVNVFSNRSASATLNMPCCYAKTTTSFTVSYVVGYRPGASWEVKGWVVED